MRGVSTAFKRLGEICSSIEQSSSDHSLTQATPKGEDILETETVSMEIGIKIPFLGNSDIDPRNTVSIQEVQLKEDGSLHIKCLAQTPSQQTESGEQTDSPTDSSRSPSNSTIETTSPEPPTDSDSQSEQEPEGHEQSTEGDQNVNDETSNGEVSAEVPPYRDPEKLQQVYDEYSTFSEMTDALDVEVTPQTVRRYMIKHNIHQPSPNTGSSSINTLLEADPDSLPLKSNDQHHEEDDDDNQSEEKGSAEPSITATGVSQNTVPNETSEDISAKGVSHDGGMKLISEQVEGEDDTDSSASTAGSGSSTTSDSEEPTAISDEKDEGTALTEVELPDDVELPDHLTLEEVKTAVRDAKTLYEAKEKLEMERGQAQEFLQRLNLLDLVQGRLSTRDFQERTLDEINQRIQSAH